MAEPAAPEVPREAPPGAGSPPVGAIRDAGPAAPPPAPDQLSPEEQMVRFERELKEQDWGHQPC